MLLAEPAPLPQLRLWPPRQKPKIAPSWQNPLKLCLPSGAEAAEFLFTHSGSDTEFSDQEAEGRGGGWAESTEPGVLIKAQFGIQIQKFPRFQVWGMQVREGCGGEESKVRERLREMKSVTPPPVQVSE